jgi:nucleoside-diphosphate-sugar epimerase
MKVLLAGASGAIGIPLTRQLLAHDHEVLGLTRDQAGTRRLRAVGATPVVADALAGDGLLRAVHGLSADAVIHELTALRRPPLRHRGMALTNRLGSEGTTNLLAAAESLGPGGSSPSRSSSAMATATTASARSPRTTRSGCRRGTAATPRGRHALHRRAGLQRARGDRPALRPAVRGDAEHMRDRLARRGVPVARGGALGWVHHEDAAAATVAALERGRPGQAYNVVDDLPASWQEVFITMARALGTPPPPHLPGWLLRLVAPYVASFVVGASMRVANAKAKAELGWRPRYPNYRAGIHAMVAAAARKEEPWPSPGRSGAGTRSA